MRKFDLATEAELQARVLPVLTLEDKSEADPSALEAALVAATFSQLCEPSDRLFGFLAANMPTDALLRLLISRSTSATFAVELGSDAVAEAEDAFNASIDRLWQDSTERWLPRLSQGRVFESLRHLAALRGHLIWQESKFYPCALLDLGHSAPPALWARGNYRLLEKRETVAVVGSRSTNHYGLEVTAQLAGAAVDAGITVVSGGAFGIDAAAHSATLRLGGDTIAVMAGGVDRLYPKTNQDLLEEVVAKGLVVSEVPIGVTPAKWRFLMRNRLIAALGMGTVVVQAGKTSGSLNTARHAVELNRPVAVVPGPITSPFSLGCHLFANENPGAVHIMAQPSKLAQFLGLANDLEPALPGLGALEVRALDTFTGDPIDAFQIQQGSGLTNVELQIALGSLEAAGLVMRVGARFMRTPT